MKKFASNKKYFQLSIFKSLYLTKALRLILSFLITFQTIFIHPVFAQANLTQVQQNQLKDLEINNTQSKLKSLYKIGSLLNSNPIIEQIINSKEIDPSLGFREQDLDQNPFFMRSQRWDSQNSTSESKSNSIVDVIDSQHIRVYSSILSLPAILKINHIGLDYIYLTANKSLFTSKEISQESGGLFLINKVDLIRAQRQKSPIAIMHLPLPGNNWATEDSVQVKENQLLGTVNISNSQDLIPFEFKDLKVLIEVQKTNLLLAQTLNLTSQKNTKSLSKNNQSTVTNLPDLEHFFVLPPKGSTAGFGLVFTGQNLEAKTNIFQIISQQSENNLIEKLKYFGLRKVISVVNQYMGSQQGVAHAVDWNQLNQVEITSPAVAKLVYVSSIIGVLFVSSVVLKYTVLRTRISEIEAYQKQMKDKLKSEVQFQTAKTIADSNTFLQQVLSKASTLRSYTKEQYRNFIEKNPRIQSNIDQMATMTQAQLNALKKDVDILAHLLTMSATISSYSVATAIEFFGDRFAKGLFAADNMMIRKILNFTVYYSRANASRVPVNTKTLWLGAVVMGTVDTYIVSVQINTVVPWMSSHLKSITPDFIDRRIENAFEVPSEAQAQLARESILSNGVAWGRTGASQYASEAKYQYYAAIEREVKDLLQKQGIDPDKPENKSMLDNLIDVKLNLQLKKLGLPDTNEYIVGIDTMFDRMFALLGYRLPKAQHREGQFYYLEARPGLAISTLNNALTLAYRLDSEGSLINGQETRQILQDTLRSFSLLRSTTKALAESVIKLNNPLIGMKQAYQQTIEFRQSILMLSHNGAIDFNAQELIPDSWKKQGFSIEAMNNAAYLFRLSLVGTLNDDQFLLHLSASQLNEIRQKQGLNVNLKKDSLENVLTAIDSEYKKQNQERDELKANSYELILDRYQQKVHNSAIQFANEVLINKQIELNQPLISKEAQKIYFKAYTEQAANEINLYVDEKTDQRLIAYSDTQAAQILESALEHDQKLIKYLSKLDQKSQLAVLGFYYANSWFVSYKTATGSLGMVSATSPDQPGRFQKIRRTEFVRNSQFLTRSLRVVEALYNNEAYLIDQTERKNATKALRSDFISSLERTIRIAPLYLTTSYLYNSAVWNVSVPYGSYVVGLLFVFSIIVPSQILNRIFVMQGIEPMGGTLKKIGFGLIYATVTFFPMFPESLFGPDIAKALDKAGEKIVLMAKAEKSDQRKTEMKAEKVIAIPGTAYQIRLENKCRSVFMSN